jgi:hypothetical protein
MTRKQSNANDELKKIAFRSGLSEIELLSGVFI